MLKIYNQQIRDDWDRLKGLVTGTVGVAIGHVKDYGCVPEPRWYELPFEARDIADVPIGSALAPALLIVFWVVLTIVLALA
jgi:hypothetical protein